MLGVIVNFITVAVGGTIGSFIKGGIPEKYSTLIQQGLALCVMTIGISGALKGQDTLKLILSMVAGTLIGEALDLDGKVHRLGDWVEKRFSKGTGKTSIAEGFVTASLLFCVGAMTIVGSLQSGLTGDHTMLFTKSLLDFVSSISPGKDFPQSLDGLRQAVREQEIDFIVVYTTDETFDAMCAQAFSDGLDYVRATALPCLYRVEEDGTFALVAQTVYPVPEK